LTAALGRYVGGRQTTGELVLFLDGDMELCPGWLARALRTMRECPDVAAVAGTVVDLPADTPGTTGHWPDEVVAAWRTQPAPVEVTNTGGAALHRRRVLDAVGAFHPFLRSEEEPELCLRIRRAGHRVVHNGAPIALHYSTPARSVATLLARRRRRLYEGMGQVMRHHAGSPTGRLYVRERGFGVVPGLALLAGAGALATGVGARRWWPLALWSASLTSTVGVHAVRRRSVADAVFSLVQRGCIVEGTVRGLLARPVAPEAHPARFEVVQAIPAREAIAG
jgi:Glycosyl transferase family group 2